MPAKAVITAPVPTVPQTAREMGVAKARVRELQQLMTAIVEGRDGRVVRVVTRTATLGPKRRVVAKRGGVPIAVEIAARLPVIQ